MRDSRSGGVVLKILSEVFPQNGMNERVGLKKSFQVC